MRNGLGLAIYAALLSPWWVPGPASAQTSTTQANEFVPHFPGARCVFSGPGPNVPPPSVEPGMPPKQLRAKRIDGENIDFDGRLVDLVWDQANFVCDFWQREPDEREPATQHTEVAFLFDRDALWVGARMFSDDPTAIQAFRTRRDASAGSGSERLWISLDPYRNRRTAYSFIVNASGVRSDYFHPRDDSRERDLTFDPVWQARVHRDSLGWSTEMRIPLSQLRFNADPNPVWGVNMNRYIPSLKENVVWALIVRGEPGWPSRFGEMVGLEGIRPSRRLEMMPYVGNQLDAKTSSPLKNGQISGRVGGDIKLGLGPNLTLDGTVNPDFGQVEADPAVVNLTAFESVFEERRPFFTEGRQLLEGIGPRYFYSRRIGAPPHGTAPGDSVDAPEWTTILGAAKLTGRLPSRTSIGALFAVTAEETAHTFDFPSDAEVGMVENHVPVEPMSWFGVARLQQEIDDIGSIVGATFTTLKRDKKPGLRDLLIENAITGGADWNLRFTRGEYELSGHVGYSHVQGDSTALLRLQRSSSRYYQRPDAIKNRLDPSAKSLDGYSAAIEMEKAGGEDWLGRARFSMISPGFEINDLGQLFNADELAADIDFSLRETLPGDLTRHWQFGVTSANRWNYDGVRTETELGLFADVTWLNYLRTVARLEYLPRALSDDLTRGGPLMQTVPRWKASLNLNNDRSSTTRFRGKLGYGQDDLRGWEYELSTGLTFRGHAIQFSLDPTYSRQLNSRQFFTHMDGGRRETFGSRYIFSFIDRSTLSMKLRASYAFLPDLTLELYAEPFVASGLRTQPGELFEPGSQDLLKYGEVGTTAEKLEDGSWQIQESDSQFKLPNGDFNITSFRSNLVVRWEWRPGSTIFFVWQQDRSDMFETGELVDPGRLIDSFDTPGRQIFLIKVSYWLPL